MSTAPSDDISELPRLEAIPSEGASFASFAPPIRPPSLSESARHGVAGDFVRIVEPHTEADPAALLFQFLVFAGNCFGRNRYVVAEADRHYANLYTCVVGDSSKGRKGTSLGHVRRTFAEVDSKWLDQRVLNGLSSGEGLIHCVRDPREIPTSGTTRVNTGSDPGVQDKRLMVCEAEFASVLRQFSRQGNTLSTVLREAWDGNTLRTMTKSAPECATHSHVSLVAHITTTELIKTLEATETANGFANRFLWPYVRRAQLLPEGGSLDPYQLRPIIERLRSAKEKSAQPGEVQRSAAFRAGWRDLYPALARDRLGLAGAICSRAEAQVLRLALLYSILDLSDHIDIAHLRAAEGAWQFCEASAQHIFGASTGDILADRIQEIVDSKPEGIGRSEIVNALGRHAAKHQLDSALSLLERMHRARCLRVPTRGRPAETWFPGRSIDAK